MFVLISKKLFKTLKLGNSDTHFKFSSIPSVKDKIKSINEEYNNSFTVSYLIKSCGLTLENAIIASEKVEFETPDRPDSVLSLLKAQGFSSTRITKLVGKLPSLLFSNPQRSLLPKIEFLRSIGVSSYDITRILSSDPTLFRRSLENQIIPCYNFLKNIVGTDEMVVRAFKRSSVIFSHNVQKNLVPNLALLRELDVPQSSVLLLICHFPMAAFMMHNRFVKIVEELKRMGFNPQKSMFVQAIKVCHVLGKETVERKFEVYDKWGWSKDEALLAFRSQPHCMALSEQRIQKTMDFLVNKMGWPSKVLAKYPVVLCFSVEKRLIPRCSVFQVLVLKGLVKEDMSILTLMLPDEVTFVKKFVTRFLEHVPQLMDLYEGKADLSSFTNGYGET